MAIQALESIDQETSHGWSFTRSCLYAACPRAFYFSRRLRSLEATNDGSLLPRNALNLSSLVGIAVHRSIADQIGKWAAGERMEIGKTQSEAEAWLKHVWENLDWRIIEAANGRQVDPRLLSKLIHTAKRRIHTFFFAVWPQFRDHVYLLHETLRSFSLHGNCVWVKVDLCTRNPSGEIVITDWKTGQPSILQNDVLQMCVYALWAADRFSEVPTDIYVQLANLRTGGVVPQKLSRRQLDDSIEHVLEDCHRWSSQAMDDYVAKPDVNRCCSCRHLETCADGQEVTGMQI